MANPERLDDDDVGQDVHETTGKTSRLEYQKRGRLASGSKYRVVFKRGKGVTVEWPAESTLGEEVEIVVKAPRFRDGTEVALHIEPTDGGPGPRTDLRGTLAGGQASFPFTPTFEATGDDRLQCASFSAEATVADKKGRADPLRVKAILQLDLVLDSGEPAAAVEYVLHVGGELIEGTSDAQGRLEAGVHPAAREGTLAFLYDDGYCEKVYTFELSLEPPAASAEPAAS